MQGDIVKDNSKIVVCKNKTTDIMEQVLTKSVDEDQLEHIEQLEDTILKQVGFIDSMYYSWITINIQLHIYSFTIKKNPLLVNFLNTFRIPMLFVYTMKTLGNL